MATSSRYMPLFVDMTGKKVLVVGAGAVASRKVDMLLAHGVNPHVIALGACEHIAHLAEQGDITLETRSFKPADADGCFLVYATTNDSAANDAVIEASCARGALVCAADRRDFELITPSEIVGEGLHIAISTDGKDPARSKRARIALEKWLASWEDEQ